MKYKVLSSTSTDGLMSEVNKHLQQGWRPLGGLAYNSDLQHYYQAVCLEFTQITSPE